MRIGELAQACGVNPKTIRYYEALGLLPPTPRSAAAQRLYSREDLRRLQFIRRATQLGIPLARIREIVTYAYTGGCQHLRPRLRALVSTQLVEIEARLKELRALRRELQRHHASLAGPRTAQPTDGSCACLAGSSRIPPNPPGGRPGPAAARERISTGRR